jgi:hypothetical protein
MSDRAESFIVLARKDLDLPRLVSVKDPGNAAFHLQQAAGKLAKAVLDIEGIASGAAKRCRRENERGGDEPQQGNGIRTHRSLNKDAPVSRLVQRAGVIRSRAILGGLHHHYGRI